MPRRWHRTAAGQPWPSEGGLSTEAAEELLALAVEEKRERVRKLRIANDEKERLLIPGAPAEAYAFAFVRMMPEGWQLWPDGFGPELAAKDGLESCEVIQDLRDAVPERLKQQSRVKDLHLHGLRPEPLVQIPARLLDYRGRLSFDQNMRRSLAPPPGWLVWQWADERRKLSRKHAKRVVAYGLG